MRTLSVKQEIYGCKRHGLWITLVAGSRMRIPEDEKVTLKIVDPGLDAADDWIEEHVDPDDIVITGTSLAARCLARTLF